MYKSEIQNGFSKKWSIKKKENEHELMYNIGRKIYFNTFNLSHRYLKFLQIAWPQINEVRKSVLMKIITPTTYGLAVGGFTH